MRDSRAVIAAKYTRLSGKRILFFVKKGDIFLDEHRHILLALRQAGAEVSIAAQTALSVRALKSSGKGTPQSFPVSELDFSDHGIKPLAELTSLRQSFRLLRSQRPHIVVAYTIKPILYSALASHLLGLSLRLSSLPVKSRQFFHRSLSRKDSSNKESARNKTSANKASASKEEEIKSFRLIAFFTGLGRTFMSRQLFHRALSLFLCFLLRDASQLWVLNEHNRSLLRRKIPRRADRVLLSVDMGIDLSRFRGKRRLEEQPTAKLKRNKTKQRATIRFLYLSRLLRAKGVGEYLEAASLLRDKPRIDPKQSPTLEFLLAGDYAENDPDSYPLSLLARAHERGDINWLSQGIDLRVTGIKREDIVALLETVDCLVLPSYAEGLPRVILEAAAMEVPAIIACYGGWQRVVAGADNPTRAPNPPTHHTISNALTCACRDSDELARTMLRFSQLPLTERRSMGLVAREYVASHFSQERACDFYLTSLANAAAEIDD